MRRSHTKMQKPKKNFHCLRRKPENLNGHCNSYVWSFEITLKSLRKISGVREQVCESRRLGSFFSMQSQAQEGKASVLCSQGLGYTSPLCCRSRKGSKSRRITHLGLVVGLHIFSEYRETLASLCNECGNKTRWQYSARETGSSCEEKRFAAARLKLPINCGTTCSFS